MDALTRRGILGSAMGAALASGCALAATQEGEPQAPAAQSRAAQDASSSSPAPTAKDVAAQGPASRGDSWKEEWEGLAAAAARE